MSQTKISRIETGRALPTVIDVERILKALDVPDEVADELLRLARRANVDYASWRAYARVGLYHKQAELRALESSSRVMRHFLPAIPTGLLHVYEYAIETLSPTVAGDPARDVVRAVQARMDRQAIWTTHHALSGSCRPNKPSNGNGRALKPWRRSAHTWPRSTGNPTSKSG
nr:Scr1 family TA system antitoxin-like transcriptional regulator [Streptomyces sp. Amel2xC10]